MSKHRIDPKAGWCNQSKLPKGPDGRNLCRQCGVQVPKGRLTFCSDACVDEWKIKTNPGHARKLVFKRDNGVCQSCGLDTAMLEHELKLLRAREVKMVQRLYGHGAYYAYPDRRAENPFAQRCRHLALPLHLWSLDKSFWEMDHALPVCEGGGTCGLENLRTLCWRCHARETRRLRGRRARWQQLELPLP